MLLGLLLPSGVEAANRFLTCATACTITAADTTIWGTTSGGVGASVPGSGDAVILDAATCVGGVTCTATMGAAYNPTWQSITMGACTASTTGCIFDWSANNNSPILTATTGMSLSGSGTRNLKMGNGTWSITSTSGAWTATTTTNLTFNANSSTIAFASVASTNTRTFNGGSLTYNTVTVGANSSGGRFIVAGSNTFGVLTITGQNALTLTQSTTQVITTLNLNGSSSGQIFVSSSILDTIATISVASNAPTMTWVGFRDTTGFGGASFVATNSSNLGNNSGITITPPSTSGGGRIIGGWLLRRDLYHDNDNNLAWLERAA